MLPVEIAEEVERFVEVARARWDHALISVVLFGSWARGEARPESDIDLLVIRAGFPKSRLDRHMELFEAAKGVSRGFASRISIVPLTPEEARETKPFYLGMLTACAILHDRDDFFRTLLRRLDERLRALGAQRRTDKDGFEYWVLKADYQLGEMVEL
jgi:predicted nucleotidyltransferase